MNASPLNWRPLQGKILNSTAGDFRCCGYGSERETSRGVDYLRLQGFTVGDTRFAIGTVETASPAAIEKHTPELLTTMQRIAQDRGYTSFLFMMWISSICAADYSSVVESTQ